jgi:hypothetical protein
MFITWERAEACARLLFAPLLLASALHVACCMFTTLERAQAIVDFFLYRFYSQAYFRDSSFLTELSNDLRLHVQVGWVGTRSRVYHLGGWAGTPSRVYYLGTLQRPAAARAGGVGVWVLWVGYTTWVLPACAPHTTPTHAHTVTRTRTPLPNKRTADAVVYVCIFLFSFVSAPWGGRLRSGTGSRRRSTTQG